uniref:Uncharacterized protein n=1 Tax=Parascaris univalens TaxID=6257 RepID=A0A914ZYE5_PARUN
AFTVEACESTPMSDNAEQNRTINNTTSAPDESADKGKVEAQKQSQLSQSQNVNEPEEKTRFEKVNAVARPAVSRGRKRSSLRWKNNNRFEERASREKRIGTINERIKTSPKDILSAETDGANVNDEPEERTKFEFVDVKRRPAVSRGRRKRSLKWKGSDHENNARNVNEPATCEETVTQEQGESQDDSATATDGGQKLEMVQPDNWPSLGKYRRKGHLRLKGKEGEQRRKSHSSTTEEESTPDGSTDNDGDKLLTQDEVERGLAVSKMESKISLSRSVRALEIIQNAALLEGVLSEKENASVAAFFANPTNLTTNAKLLVKKALGVAIERLMKITTDDQLKGLFDDRGRALDEMLQDLLANRSLLPSCWVQITGNEKSGANESSTTPSQTSSGKKLVRASSQPNELKATNPVVTSSPKVVKTPEKSRGVMKVFERSKWNKSLRSWRRSEKSHKSEKNEHRRKSKEDNKQQKNVELDEKGKKAWREAEAERTSFLAFALPAAYRFFGFK